MAKETDVVDHSSLVGTSESSKTHGCCVGKPGILGKRLSKDSGDDNCKEGGNRHIVMTTEIRETFDNIGREESSAQPSNIGF